MNRHPVRAAHDEIGHLADVANRGESPATLPVLIGLVALIVLPLVALVVAVAGLTAYLITGGAWPFS